MATDDCAYSNNNSGMMVNLPGGAPRVKSSGKTSSQGGSADLSLMGMLAKMGLLSPLAFRLWCYVRPFIA
ncbi:MAG TPA: hypothetical protein VMT71_17185 [Syntrophorhabdales bacterium]|nr:hypothetical protein [Syntrophorhabdales bacterium]